MSPTEKDAFSHLWWGTKRYWFVVVLGFAFGLAATGAGMLDGALSSTPKYEATALVVARELQIKPDQLGRTAEAIFTGGEIAEDLVDWLADSGVEADPSTVIPERVRLEPVTDTVAIRVIGSDRDPRRAAEIANFAADSLASALNDIGPGLGVFAAKDRARAPMTERPDENVVVPLLAGAFGGIILGLTFVALILLLRRPVLSADEASRVAGTGVLAVLTVPRRRRAVAPEAIGGLSLLARRLYPDRGGAAALVGCGSDRASRVEITRLLARLLARRGHVYVLASPEDRGEALDTLEAVDRSVTIVTSWLSNRLRSSIEPLHLVREDAPLLFSLSAKEYDVPQLLPEATRSALVVAEGTRSRLVEGASAQFVPGELHGIVFVQRRHRRGGSERTAENPSRKPEPAVAAAAASLLLGPAEAPTGHVENALPEPEAPSEMHRDEGSGQVGLGGGVDGGGRPDGGRSDADRVGHGGDDRPAGPLQPGGGG